MTGRELNSARRPTGARRRRNAVVVLAGFFLLLLTMLPGKVAALDAAALEQGFAHPPNSARPWVNWFWLDGNLTREGLLADLEAMQRVGLGGALIMEVDQNIPRGPVRFGSPPWREMVRHAIAEADRLGLELGFHNGPGWCGSGGPWITPELSMQRVTSSLTNLAGPARFEGFLPPLLRGTGYRRDIAVLAFPTLVGDGARMPGLAPKLTASDATGLEAQKLFDGNLSTFVTLPLRKAGKASYVGLTFPDLFTAQRLTLTDTGRKLAFEGTLQVSDDGRSYRDVRDFVAKPTGVTVEFPEVTARHFRILLTQSDPRVTEVQLAEIELVPVYRIASYGVKSGLGRGPTSGQPASIPSRESIIPLSRVVDLTSRVQADGRLLWDVPAGQWTVLRLGHIPTGRENPPAPAEGRGLECDKLSQEAVEAHFAGLLAKIIAAAGDAAGRALTFTHVDSWEVGYQNWTPQFPTEFRARRGYDPTPYLPALTGRVVENLEVSERFLWDVRRTIADLVADNYAGHLADLAHRRGLRLSAEAYGHGPFDNLQYAGRVDAPMSEFWLEADDYAKFHTSKSMASAAHTYGHPLVAAEAFTAWPQNARWQNHPFSLKRLGDAAFTYGVNRLIIHRYAMQPWLDRRPGMTLGFWGVHYERTQTWWEQSKPWHEYLARCQFLLQQGRFVADLCYLTDEGAHAEPPTRDELQPPLPAGFDYDLVAPEVVLTRMTCKEGRLVLPDGLGYRVLVLSPRDRMTPALLRKIGQLVAAGATVVGPRPTGSPSLAGYPQCDDEVRQLAGDLWGDCDGRTVKEQRVGKGKMVWGRPLADVLAELGATPDFRQLEESPGKPLRWIHRSIAGADCYFVANPNLEPANVQCAFRVAGRQPEFWHPDTGQIERAASWQEQSGSTVVPLSLDPGGSVFVLFRETSRGLDPVTVLTRDGKEVSTAKAAVSATGGLQLLVSQAGVYEATTATGRKLRAQVRDLPAPLEIAGAWELSFPANAGAPARVTIEKLTPWNEYADPGVKFFSGTATYRKSFDLPRGWLASGRRAFLDLGKVQVIAEMKLNGRELGVLWKPPFRLDVTDVAEEGRNLLEVKVTNLWPNRLIGDEQLPDDCQWRPLDNMGQALTEWPAWLLEGKPSPTGRITFATWKHWTRDSPLLESGLIGPVTLRPAAQIGLAPEVASPTAGQPPPAR